jgi:hypothetical protein
VAFDVAATREWFTCDEDQRRTSMSAYGAVGRLSCG